MPTAPTLARPGMVWVLVADGGAARLYEQPTRASPLREVPEFGCERDRTSSMARDRPSRVHDRFGPHRHALTARQSLATTAENRFLADIAARIEQAASVGGFNHLIIFAPAHALGVLRKTIGLQTRARLWRSESKDLLGADAEEILRRLK
jgi:protein required for attachment to host cells